MRPNSLPNQIMKAAATLMAALLVGCISPPASAGLQRYPPAVPTHLGGVESPTPTPPPTATASGSAAPFATVPPALALPDESGTTVGCESNTLHVSLATGGRLTAVSRVAAYADWLYILADGGLYRTRLIDADLGAPALEPLLLPGQTVANRPVQELLDLAVDEAAGRLYLLDKIGHVFRYEPFSKQTAQI